MAAERKVPTPAPGRGPAHAVSFPSHRLARAIGMVLTAVLTAAVTAGLAFYFDLNNSITVNNALDGLQTEKKKNPNDPFSGQALNLLIIGTDYRGDAANAALAGEEDGMRADTTMLVHVSANRKWVEVFSIPRDLLVTIPSCTRSDGSETREQHNAMFNAAFQTGGGPDEDMTSAAACTAKTVRELTGITPNHLMVVKMSGVVKIVDSLGTVEMCLPEALKEQKRYGGLDLPAGRVELNGRASLGYLRARHLEGMDGSDLKRIERQQMFLNALQYQITRSGMLSDPAKVYQFAKAVLGATEVDPDLGKIQNWPGLAWSLRNLNSANVVFSSLGIVDSTSQPGRVEMAGGSAGAENDALFQRFIDDTPPPGVVGVPAPAGTAGKGAASTAPSQGTAPKTPAAGPQGGATKDGPLVDTGPTPTPTPTVPIGVCPS